SPLEERGWRWLESVSARSQRTSTRSAGFSCVARKREAQEIARRAPAELPASGNGNPEAPHPAAAAPPSVRQRRDFCIQGNSLTRAAGRFMIVIRRDRCTSSAPEVGSMFHVSRGMLLAATAVALGLLTLLPVDHLAAQPAKGAAVKGDPVKITTIDGVDLHGLFFTSAKKDAPT